MPVTSSTSPSTTGIREKPLLRNSPSLRAGGRAGVDRDHVGARHHHLAHDGVVELEDRVDELAVALLEHVELGGLVDHAEQLVLGRERGEAGAAGGHPVAEGDERVGEGPEQHAQEVHQRRREPQQAVGVRAADAARAGADEHEGDGGHDQRREQQHEPDVAR